MAVPRQSIAVAKCLRRLATSHARRGRLTRRYLFTLVAISGGASDGRKSARTSHKNKEPVQGILGRPGPQPSLQRHPARLVHPLALGTRPRSPAPASLASLSPQSVPGISDRPTHHAAVDRVPRRAKSVSSRELGPSGRARRGSAGHVTTTWSMPAYSCWLLPTPSNGPACRRSRVKLVIRMRL